MFNLSISLIYYTLHVYITQFKSVSHSSINCAILYFQLELSLRKNRVKKKLPNIEELAKKEIDGEGFRRQHINNEIGKKFN